MLTSMELSAFTRELAATKVLTAYVDARVTDPAMRPAWRPELAAAVGSAGTPSHTAEIRGFAYLPATLEEQQRVDSSGAIAACRERPYDCA